MPQPVRRHVVLEPRLAAYRANNACTPEVEEGFFQLGSNQAFPSAPGGSIALSLSGTR